MEASRPRRTLTIATASLSLASLVISAEAARENFDGAGNTEIETADRLLNDLASSSVYIDCDEVGFRAIHDEDFTGDRMSDSEPTRIFIEKGDFIIGKTAFKCTNPDGSTVTDEATVTVREEFTFLGFTLS